MKPDLRISFSLSVSCKSLSNLRAPWAEMGQCRRQIVARRDAVLTSIGWFFFHMSITVFLRLQSLVINSPYIWFYDDAFFRSMWFCHVFIVVSALHDDSQRKALLTVQKMFIAFSFHLIVDHDHDRNCRKTVIDISKIESPNARQDCISSRNNSSPTPVSRGRENGKPMPPRWWSN